MKRHILFTIISWLPLLLFAQNHLLIENGTQTRMSGGYLVMTNADFENTGDFQSTAGTAIVRGTAATTNTNIGGIGTTQFSNFELDKTSEDAQLSGDIEVTYNTIMTSGNLDLNGYTLTLGEESNGIIMGESETTRIFGPNGGEIIKEVTLNNPSNRNPGNMGLVFTTSSSLGLTTIRRSHTHPDASSGNIIERYFDITPTSPANNVNFILHYFDAELNNLSENQLLFWQDADYTTWSRDNIVAQNPVDDIALCPNIPAQGMITLGSDKLFVATKVMLPSNYNSGTNLMDATLLAIELLPETEPYTALGYPNLQNAGISTTLSISGTTDDIVDWALVELRDASNPSDIVALRAALLKRDGNLVDVDGKSPVPFEGVEAGSYYIAVRHRNHLGVMSATPIMLSY